MNGQVKPARRTRAELKQLMVDAGKEVLLGLEPTIGFEGLTYSAVFEQVRRLRGEKVTNASVHERIWQSQHAYRIDVLSSIVNDTAEHTFKQSRAAALGALESVDKSTVVGRKRGAQDVMRVMQNYSANQDEFAGFSTREEELAFIVRNRLREFDQDDEAIAGIAELVRQHRERSSSLYIEMAVGLMAVLRLRIRSDFVGGGLELFAVLCNSIVVGLITDPLPQAHAMLQLPTGPTGELEAWHPSSIGMWTLARQMFEIDDDSLTEAERRL